MDTQATPMDIDIEENVSGLESYHLPAEFIPLDIAILNLRITDEISIRDYLRADLEVQLD